MSHRQVDAVYQQLMTMHTKTLPVALLLLVTPLFLLLLLRRTRSRRDDKQQPQASIKSNTKDPMPLPPSPPCGLPIIGHLHLVGDRPHVSLRDLAAKHGGGGGMMLLRLGAVRTLVVSSPRAAEAILRTHDHVFASRPKSVLVDTLLYGSSDIGFAPYGEHWRQLRKLVTTHLFTVKKVRSFRHARQEEVRLVMARIRRHHQEQQAAAAVDMSELLNAFANDVVCRAVSGKFFRKEGRNKLFRELIDMNSRLFGGFGLLEDGFPGLAEFPLINWFLRRKAKEGHRRWDDLLEKIITDHESSRRCGDDEEGDFIHVLLSVQKEYRITRNHIKAILMDMFGAGTDTSSLVLELAMTELMRNPHIMTKLQAEVRSKTPKGQEMVAEENLATMSYLRAVVKETLRLRPPVPLLLPHLSLTDCERLMDCYKVPSGTRVIVNAWAIHRDPESWENPEDFMPERFMEGGSATCVDFRGNDFQFLPFGAGRRVCPGLNFGLATVEIMLANLVYCFDWGLPAGMEKEDIDMTEVFGLTVRPKEKLLLIPKPHGAS